MGWRYIVVATLAVFLHSTNPSFDEFKGYITNSIQFDKERGSIFGAWGRSIAEDIGARQDSCPMSYAAIACLS
jgi:hypothetical protein